MKDAFNWFMAEVRQWVADGCPKHPVFHRKTGLCVLFDDYLVKRGAMDGEGFAFAQDVIFKKKSFPFNSGRADYREEHLKAAMYENPRRLAFIHNWEPSQ